MGHWQPVYSTSITSPTRCPHPLLSLLKCTSLNHKCSKVHLQQLVCKLNWVALVVWGGCTFLGCLITLPNSVKCPYHGIFFNLQARSDLHWWTFLLPAHNCKTLFPSESPQLSTPVLTNASLCGRGCIWGTDWMYVNWALDYPTLSPHHINYK